MTDKPRVYGASADDSDVPDRELGALFARYREPPNPARAERITAHVRRVSESRNPARISHHPSTADLQWHALATNGGGKCGLVLFGTLSLWRVLLEMAATIYVAIAGPHPKRPDPLTLNPPHP